jgi:hypothetical protein
MKVKDLPKAIKERAMPYIKKEFPNKKHRPKELTQSFNWIKTKEGASYWCEVSFGNFIKAEEMLKKKIKEESPLIAKMIEELENAKPIVEDTIKWSEEGRDRSKPFFLDEVLVNEPEVVKPDNNLPWHLTTEDAPIFNSGDTKTDAINLGIQSVRIINDSFKKAIEMKRDRIVEGVIEKFRSRSEVGIKKYGTTLDRNDLSLEQWLDHAIEEQMDSILYLTKIKEDLKNK